MTKDDIEKLRIEAMHEIKEKIHNNNRKLLHPTNREFQEYRHKLGFKTGNEFTAWMQNNGILKNPTDVDNRDAEIKIRNAGCKDLKEYRDKCAQKLGYKDRKEYKLEYIYGPIENWKKDTDQNFYEYLESQHGREFADWAKQNKDNVPSWFINAGCKTQSEWINKLAQKKGFENDADRQRDRCHNKGEYLPMEFNEDCSSNFGIDKGETLFERFLLTIFEHVEHMKNNNKWFDFICKNPSQEFIDKYPQFKLERDKEYKIQLSNRCLRHSSRWQSSCWCFSHINYNNKPDYFIFCGWDNRDSLNPTHIWIFHKNDIIRGDKFWRRDTLSITDKQKYINDFLCHELIGELKTLKEIKQTIM